MKNLFKALAMASLLILSGCSNEELNEDLTIAVEDVEADNVSANLTAKVTPIVGGIYTITSVKSGRTLDISGASNNNGANLQVWGTNSNTSATHRQWEVISTGGNYVRLKGVDSGKSLEVSGGNNSNGANVQQWAYQGTTHQQWEIISVGSNNFRLKNRDSGKSLRVSGTSNGSNADQYAYKGWSSQKFYFTEVGGGSSGGGGGGSSSTPGGVLGITNSMWKLNGFTATPSSSATYYDDVMDQINGNLATWSNSNYFYENNGYAYFKCYRGLGTSQNSQNPRVELRELDGGVNQSSWSNEGTNSMEFDVRVDQLSKNASGSAGVTCVGQIHGPGDSVDDIIRVQFYGSANQSSGNVRLKISGYITEDVLGSSQFIDNGYKLDTTYRMKIQYNSDDYVSVFMNGSRIFHVKMDTDKDNNYFKLGNYIQDSKGASFDGSYALVGIKNLTIVHN